MPRRRRVGQRRRGHDRGQPCGERLHDPGVRLRRSPCIAAQLQGLDDPHGLLALPRQAPHGKISIPRNFNRRHQPKCPAAGILLVSRPQPPVPGDPEARRHRPGDRHPGCLGSLNRQRYRKPVQCAFRNLNVMPTPQWSGGADQECPSGLVPSRHQVSHSDHRLRAGPPRQPDFGRAERHGRGVRGWCGPRGPVEGPGPRVGLRHPPRRLHPVPLRAGLQRQARDDDRAAEGELRRCNPRTGGPAELPDVLHPARRG
ncbi:unnamed protein product [Linum tenue]|uniref:Uncharacterized protein n=1 Tax=Linum tenue TaxID=586396 RepID=A0AAV0INQ2_9ROSI|nr:unnamed protein product [Linum tenue]